MKKLFVGLVALVLIGAGCAKTPVAEGIVEPSCEAYLSDSLLKKEGDRELFRNLCYMTKADETGNPDYCFSMQGFEQGDCLSYLAGKLGQPEICDTYFDKANHSERNDCISNYAMISKNADVCATLDEDVQGYCVEGADGCREGRFDNLDCTLTPGAHLYCDAMEDLGEVERCEELFPIAAYGTYR